MRESMTVSDRLAQLTGLARVVRGKLLEVREEDFVMAARIAGGSAAYTIRRHLLPSAGGARDHPRRDRPELSRHRLAAADPYHGH